MVRDLRRLHKCPGGTLQVQCTTQRQQFHQAPHRCHAHVSHADWLQSKATLEIMHEVWSLVCSVLASGYGGIGSRHCCQLRCCPKRTSSHEAHAACRSSDKHCRQFKSKSSHHTAPRQGLQGHIHTLLQLVDRSAGGHWRSGRRTTKPNSTWR